MVPAGLDGARRDFARYCRIHRAVGFWSRALLPARQPALLALWLYRYGRWVHYGPRRRGPLHRALHALFFELARHLTGVLIQRWVEVEEDVWIQSHHPVIVSANRIGRGAFLFGGVTLGAGLSAVGRGLPTLGAHAVIGPGACCTGPVSVPEGSVVGANAVVTRSLWQARRGWVGAPATLYHGPREALIPRIERGAA